MRLATCLAFLALGLLAAIPRARGANFDCAKAATASEKAVCADPALSKADDALAAAYADALAATLDPQPLVEAQRAWIVERDKLDDAAKLGDLYLRHTERLRAIAAAWSKTPRNLDPLTLQSRCWRIPDAPEAAQCKVEEFDEARSKNGPPLHYQLQAYTEDELRVSGGAVVFVEIEGQPGRVRPIAAAYQDAGHFNEPEALRYGEQLLLLIPGHIEGTGNFNASRLFRQDAARLAPIDLAGWLGDLGAKLPAGLAVWKGVYPDFETMTADTPLWKEGDGNCCPTGGRALIHLALKGQSIVLDRFTVKLGKEFAQEDEIAVAAGTGQKPAAPPPVCGKTVPMTIDEASFSNGLAREDPLARETAESAGPTLVGKAFDRLCELELISPEEVGAKVTRIVIGWAGAAEDVDAAFSREPDQKGLLRIVWKWYGSTLPPPQDFRDGILCAFRPDLSACDQSEP